MLLQIDIPRDWIVEVEAWHWAVVLGAAALMAFWLYGWGAGIGRKSTGSGLSPAGRMLLGTMRFITLAGLGFLLLEPLIRSQLFDEEQPVAVVLMDESTSIFSRGDSAAESKQILAWTDGLRTAIEGAGMTAEWYGFDKQLRPLPSTSDSTWNWAGAQTNLDAAMRELTVRIENRNIAGIILASDGLVNRGATPDFGIDWPNIPVWTLGLGDTTTVKDRWISRINHNPIAYLGNTFPIEVFVESQGLVGELAQIQVYHGGELLKSQQWTTSGDREVQKCAFQLPATDVGMQRYEVRIATTSGEIDPSNNQRTFYVEVLESRRIITCIAASPHPDLGAIRMALSELEPYEIRSFQLANLQDAQALTDALAASDVVIAHDLIGTSWGGMPWTKLVGMNDTPVWWLAASQATWTYLQQPNELGVEMTRSGDLTQTHRARLNPSFSALEFPNGIEEAIRAWPPMMGPFEQTTWSPAWSPMVYRQFGDIETNEAFWGIRGGSAGTSGARQILSIGNGLWRWRMRNYIQNGDHSAFNQFIQQQVQFLAAKDVRKRLIVQTEKRIAVDERINFRAQVYDASWSATREATVVVYLTDEVGQVYNRTLLLTEDGYAADFGRMADGNYRWKATCEVDEQTFEASGNLVIEDTQLERTNLAADHDILMRISRRTGGTFLGDMANITPESVVQEMDQMGIPAPILHEQTTLRDAVEWIALLLAILGLLTAEWIVRRRTIGY